MSKLHEATCELCRCSRPDVELMFTVVNPMYLCPPCRRRYREFIDDVTTFFNRFHRLPGEGELEAFETQITGKKQEVYPCEP